MTDRFDQFTDLARQVLRLAQEEAQRFNHNYTGTEHLPLGLVRVQDGVGARVLAELGVELNTVRSAVEFLVGRGDRTVAGDIGLTPRAKKLFELAIDTARQLDHHGIEVEHLLLGLLRAGEGIAAAVLESHGLTTEQGVDQDARCGRCPTRSAASTSAALSPAGIDRERRTAASGSSPVGP